jgi:hypothetical protein
VRALATATQTPADLAGCAVLGVLAACAGGRAVVQARPGWREPTNLYLLPVLRPGSRKSAVVSAATAVLYAVERDLVQQAQAEIAEQTTLKEIAEKAADKARQAAARAAPEKREQLIADALGAVRYADGIEVPVVPRLIADDVTPEAAATLLADHGGRLAIISAEGGIFDVMAGRYSKGVPALDVWLKGHSGDPLRVDRKGRPAEFIKHPAMTLLLTVQPAIIDAIAGNGTFRGRGLLARFLYAIPADNLGRRRVGAPPVPEDVTAEYETKVRKLAEDLAGWHDPAVLTLTPEAQELLLDAERDIEPQLSEEGRLGAIAEWGSKLTGAILRIAGLLHLSTAGHEAFRMPISRDTLANAIQIGDYFSEHALAAFGMLGATGTTDAQYVLDYLVRRQATEFSIRDLHSELPRGRFATAEDVVAAVRKLEEHGYVLRMPEPERRGPGRSPSPRFRVLHLPTESTESTEQDQPRDSVDSVDTAAFPRDAP